MSQGYLFLLRLSGSHTNNPELSTSVGVSVSTCSKQTEIVTDWWLNRPDNVSQLYGYLLMGDIDYAFVALDDSAQDYIRKLWPLLWGKAFAHVETNKSGFMMGYVCRISLSAGIASKMTLGNKLISFCSSNQDNQMTSVEQSFDHKIKGMGPIELDSWLGSMCVFDLPDNAALENCLAFLLQQRNKKGIRTCSYVAVPLEQVVSSKKEDDSLVDQEASNFFVKASAHFSTSSSKYPQEYIAKYGKDDKNGVAKSVIPLGRRDYQVGFEQIPLLQLARWIYEVSSDSFVVSRRCWIEVLPPQSHAEEQEDVPLGTRFTLPFYYDSVVGGFDVKSTYKQANEHLRVVWNSLPINNPEGQEPPRIKFQLGANNRSHILFPSGPNQGLLLLPNPLGEDSQGKWLLLDTLELNRLIEHELAEYLTKSSLANLLEAIQKVPSPLSPLEKAVSNIFSSDPGLGFRLGMYASSASDVRHFLPRQSQTTMNAGWSKAKQLSEAMNRLWEKMGTLHQLDGVNARQLNPSIAERVLGGAFFYAMASQMTPYEFMEAVAENKTQQNYEHVGCYGLFNLFLNRFSLKGGQEIGEIKLIDTILDAISNIWRTLAMDLSLWWKALDGETSATDPEDKMEQRKTDRAEFDKLWDEKGWSDLTRRFALVPGQLFVCSDPLHFQSFYQDLGKMGLMSVLSDFGDLPSMKERDPSQPDAKRCCTNLLDVLLKLHDMMSKQWDIPTKGEKKGILCKKLNNNLSSRNPTDFGFAQPILDENKVIHGIEILAGTQDKRYGFYFGEIVVKPTHGVYNLLNWPELFDQGVDANIRIGVKQLFELRLDLWCLEQFCHVNFASKMEDAKKKVEGHSPNGHSAFVSFNLRPQWFGASAELVQTMGIKNCVQKLAGHIKKHNFTPLCEIIEGEPGKELEASLKNGIASPQMKIRGRDILVDLGLDEIDLAIDDTFVDGSTDHRNTLLFRYFGDKISAVKVGDQVIKGWLQLFQQDSGSIPYIKIEDVLWSLCRHCACWFHAEVLVVPYTPRRIIVEGTGHIKDVLTEEEKRREIHKRVISRLQQDLGRSPHSETRGNNIGIFMQQYIP